MAPHRQIVIMIPEHAQLMDIAGPAQVFTHAAEAGASYEVSFYSESAQVTSHQGLHVASCSNIPELAPQDILIISGWKVQKTVRPLGATAEQIIREHAQHEGQIMSVCAGALILGRLGLLAKKKSTTHHDLVGELEKFAEVEVVRDVLYTCDGAIHTSAEISSGIDLALHLVDLDAGPALAAQIARTMVVPAWRPGGSQVSVMLKYRGHMDDVVHRAQDILDDPALGLMSLSALGARLGISGRSLSRHFVAAIGMTPYAYGAKVRDKRVQLLRSQGISVEESARLVGFADGRSLRKRT